MCLLVGTISGDTKTVSLQVRVFYQSFHLLKLNVYFSVGLGVKVSSEGDYYVSVPRWKANVPSTLNKLVLDPTGNMLLQPFPSWQMNTPGADPLALHSVLGFEIDAQVKSSLLLIIPP